jgi:hypothetical protein
MVTGHWKLRSYLHRFGLTDNPMSPCEGEEEEETTDHLICMCKKLHNQRNEMINQIKNNCGIQMKYLSIIINEYL